MTDTAETLARRIREKDPQLTFQQLEKEIAHCIGEKINKLLKEEITKDSVLLQQAVEEILGLSCQIAPELSLYVNIAEKEKPEISKEPFSSLSFERTLNEILKKDFALLKPKEVIQLTNNAINDALRHFLMKVIISHPLLVNIFQRFTAISHDQVAIFLRDPVRIIMGTEKSEDENNFEHRPGMYL